MLINFFNNFFIFSKKTFKLSLKYSFWALLPSQIFFGDQAWPQNTSDKSTTNTTNKGSDQILTRRCEILQLIPLKSPMTRRHNWTASKDSSDTKCHSPVQPARYYPFWALPPSQICFWLPHMASKRI